MIFEFRIIVIICAAVFFQTSNSQNPSSTDEKSLLVQISFDSLQEASQKFFKTQLQPIFEQFSSVVHWDFIPCSTSMIVHDVLLCKRGPEECDIDRIHACTSAIYRNDSYSLGKFFICMMTSDKQLDAGSQCADEAKFNWGEIQSCSKTDRAAQFCENRFEVLNKYHAHLAPAIFYNKKYNEDLDKASYKDLKKIICQKLAELSVSFDGCTC